MILNDIIACFERIYIMKKRIVSTVIIVICLLVFLFFGYTGNYYRTTDKNALKSTPDVSVSETDYGYFFDGPSEDKCLIFYPGGLVEDTAYSALLKIIAAKGYDCALVNMPFNLAVFNSSAAENVRKEYSYSDYYLGGHSLGGAMAADYAASHSEEYKGLLLLAAFPTKDLSESSLNVLSIYGSSDHVLELQKFKEARTLMPQSYTEKMIKGGNHDHFGNYGHQKGDRKASITNEMQQKETADLISEVFH